MASLEGKTVENGWVMGYVKTNIVNSDCSFEVCTVDEWEAMSEEEAGKAVFDAAFESGQIEIW